MSQVVYYMGVLLLSFFFAALSIDLERELVPRFEQFRVIDVLMGVLLLLLIIWGMLVLSIKRLHDRNLPGWWLFVILIPVLGFIYCTVQIAFLPGDKGQNRYGPPPMGLKDLWRLVVQE